MIKITFSLLFLSLSAFAYDNEMVCIQRAQLSLATNVMENAAVACGLGTSAETIESCLQNAKAALSGNIEDIERTASSACSAGTSAKAVNVCLKTLVEIFPGEYGGTKEELAAATCQGSTLDAIESIKNCVIETLEKDGLELLAVNNCRKKK